jgi:hypothetical protein
MQQPLRVVKRFSPQSNVVHQVELLFLNMMYGGRLNVGRSALCREMQAHTLPAGCLAPSTLPAARPGESHV